MTATMTPTPGTVVRPRPSGTPHIARRSYHGWPGSGALVETVCGKRWAVALLEPAGDERVCDKCMGAM